MHDNYVVRRMTFQDIPSVFNIEKFCFSSPWTEKMLYDELLNNSSISLVLEKNSLSAYLLARESADFIEILRIAVLPEKRKCGMATRLLNELVNISENKSLILEVNENNEPAVSLYSSFGFSVSGKRKHYYGNENAVLMDYYKSQKKEK